MALVFAAAALCGAAKSGAPQFSADGDEHWYYLVFDKTELAMQVAPNDMPITSAVFNGRLLQQMWKLVGDAESFKLVNGEGRYVSFRGKYFRNNKDASQAVSLKLHELDNGLYEIEYPEKGDSECYMASTGKDKQIAPKAAGDAQCAVGFYPVNDVWAGVDEYPVEGSTSYKPAHRHTLWYTLPVTSHTAGNTWMEYALPIGNGEFGAMVYGGIHRDQLQFNDKSAWTGSSTVRGCYQNFGDVIIEDLASTFGDEKPVKDYVRYLDLNQGLAGATYTSSDGAVTYTREYLASNPDKVVAMKVTASKPGQLSVGVSIVNQLHYLPYGFTYTDGKASFEGKLDLVDYKAVVKVVPEGGQMTVSDDRIDVIGADEVVIYLAGATNFDQHSDTYISDPEAMRSMVDSRIDAAVTKGWDAIRRDHIADHQSLFGRCELAFSGASNDIDTESLIKYYNEASTDGTDSRALMLEELYYTYGRYLLIGCSRGMDSPANLQGIWNNSNTPEWQSDIHSNINVQMNYWPAEITNLSELHMPYLNYIHSMAIEHKEWQEYARRSGMTKGWTCFTQNNIFGHSDYAENYVIANAWYTSHMWQHYRYTLDREFLKEKAMPVMLSCTDFWLERLIEAKDGSLVAPAEWSPEHGPAAQDGTAHAQQIVADLFESTIKAIEILGSDAGVSDEYVADLKAKYAKLDKGLAIENYDGKWGATLNGISSGQPLLREWKYSDYSVGQDGHRHQSHLMCLYPFAQVTPESEYFEAAVNSLRMRGDVSTGWSLGWRINLWARALDGDHAHLVLHNALRHATAYTSSQVNGGIYYNLFDSHSPFQIDGNFGYTAGVTEMLLQSYNDVIRLLPALPAEWQSGKIQGLRAENNFTVSEKWKDGKLVKVTVISGSGKPCKLIYPGIMEASVTSDSGDVTVTPDGDDAISFETKEGGKYTVLLDEGAGIDSIVEDEVDENAPVEYYNLQGIRVENPTNGFYIVKQGNKVSKRIIR